MIRIRYENANPVIMDRVDEYDYCLRDGVFELSYWIQEDPGLPPCLFTSRHELQVFRQDLPRTGNTSLDLEVFLR